MKSSVKPIIKDVNQLCFLLEDTYLAELDKYGFIESVSCGLGNLPSVKALDQVCAIRKYCSYTGGDIRVLREHVDELQPQCVGGCNRSIKLHNVDKINPSDILRTPDQVRAERKANQLDIMSLFRDVACGFDLDKIKYFIAVAKSPNFQFAMTYCVVEFAKSIFVLSCYGNGEAGVFVDAGKKEKDVLKFISRNFVQTLAIENDTDDSINDDNFYIALVDYDTPIFGITCGELIDKCIEMCNS